MITHPLFAIITIAILLIVITYLVNEIYARRLESDVQKFTEAELRESLIIKIKEKVDVSTRAEMYKRNSEDIISEYLYNKDNIHILGEELYQLHSKELDTLKATYPSLTKLDLLVLSLLSIDMDNVEICALLQMEKRTLYRRRQLMAQRIGISSTALELFAKEAIGDTASN